jgi:outer membrane protein assembly factor BamB
MLRRLLVASAALAVVLSICGPLWAAHAQLIPETTLAQCGLTRSWFAQVGIDHGRSRVSSLALCDGVLYAQTDAATIHAFDAETGKTLWSQQVGRAGYPTTPLEARGDHVAVVNGSRLYVLDRASGEIVFDREVRDAPGAGPALSMRRAFVPSVTGMVIAYQFPKASAATDETTKDKKESGSGKKPGESDRRFDPKAIQATVPLFCQSYGRALVQPLVTRDFMGGEYVVWSTDRGYLNFGRIEHDAENVLALKYRLETGGTIVARPTYLPPNPKVLGDSGIVFATSTDGFVYAVAEDNGATLWRFSTGEPILQSPVVADGRVYITTELGGMYCLSLKTGKSLWWAGNLMQFLSASKSRVYALDRTGRLLVLNAANGALLDAIPAVDASIRLLNSDTDRIYLGSEGGLIQCLHEIEQTKPLVHDKDRKDAAKAEAKRQVEEKPATPKLPEVEKPPKKEHVAPPPSATPAPKAPKAPKQPPEKKPKAPRVPRGRRAPGGNVPPGGVNPPVVPGAPPGGVQPPKN